MSGQLQGQIAIVTGGSGGIGTALCKTLAASGATVVVVDIDGAGAARVADEIRAAGGTAEGRRLDVTNPAEVTALVQDVAATYGRLDQLWNNAGIVTIGPLIDISPEDWRRVFAVNVEGALFGTQAALRQMLGQEPHPVARRKGLIVNVSSGAADRGRPMLPAYGASKAAMTHLMKTTAAAYGEQGICATAIYPSSIFEGMWKQIDPEWGAYEGLPPGEMGRRRMSESLLGRYEKPEEVAAIALRIAERTGLAMNGKIVITTPTVRDS
ncbi:MAG: SDR family oxidoreductase [Chloroflexi bacterium]|nr:SDR family oxidoreductase [Chloroflexota bacterium]